MAQPPGGGRRFNEDSVRIAMYFMSMLLIVFLALVIRGYFDKVHTPLRPVRSPAGLFQRRERGIRDEQI